MHFSAGWSLSHYTSSAWGYGWSIKRARTSDTPLRIQVSSGVDPRALVHLGNFERMCRTGSFEGPSPRIV